jgi:hypothetical protein
LSHECWGGEGELGGQWAARRWWRGGEHFLSVYES